MNKFKKFLTCAMLCSLVFSMPMGAQPTYAVDITIDQSNEDAVFSAFKLLNLTNVGDNYSYSLNERYAQTLREVTGKQSEEEIIDYISSLDADGIAKFANDVYEKIRYNGADATSVDSAFTNVEQGYYLIAETTIGSQPDSASLVMLDTLGQDSITVKTKEDIPEVEKKVMETNDSTGTTAWQDGADYDIGDSVPFQLVGTMPTDYYAYDVYVYEFHDKLSSGLTYNNDAKVYMVNGEEKIDITTTTNTTNENGELVVKFWNIKGMAEQNGWTVNADTKFVVEYTATLNDNAIVGSEGNNNTVNLVFSNDPYTDYQTGKTPDDEVIVFTYKTIVNKVDKDGNALQGAGFTLYKFDVQSNDYVAVGNEIKDVTTFEFKGLDAGMYKLVETTVPEGYNKADDVLFTIDAEYDVEADDPQFIELKVNDEVKDSFTIDNTNGSVSTDITNLSGAQLPSTGGVGTKLFYIFGIGLVAATTVVLVTRKRVGVEDEE